jgi:hypothetical protein
MTKEEIREALRTAIKKGYHPYYDLESAEDHGIDWLSLTEEEFNKIHQETKKEIEIKKKDNKTELKNLSEVVIDALKLHSSYDLPEIKFEELSKWLVIASGNALPTGKIIFNDKNALFADETQYKSIIEKDPSIEGVMVISASGKKHSPIIISNLKDKKKTFLLTCDEKSDAAIMLDENRVFTTKQIKEPITYNTSTYLGMILAKTREDPKKILNYIDHVIQPLISDMTKYRAFYLIVKNEFSTICEMFVTKFDELFGPKLNGRCYTIDQTLHAKTVVNSEKELFISFGYTNEIFGYENARLNIPLFENAGFAAMIAIGYYVIGHIQLQFPQWFMENARNYELLQPELFKKVLG